MNTLQEFLIKSAGMEKQALNLAALLRMSRNAAKKGKLSRFSELLDKRNLAIDNVAHVRGNAEKQQRNLAKIEKALIGDGPENKSYQKLLDRFVAANGDPVDINRVIRLRSKKSPGLTDQSFAEIDLHKGVAGPWTLKDLANYSMLQSKTNPIDKLTYPGL